MRSVLDRRVLPEPVIELARACPRASPPFREATMCKKKRSRVHQQGRSQTVEEDGGIPPTGRAGRHDGL